MPELKANIMIQVPIPLKVAIEQHCENHKLPVSGYIRKLIADDLDYTLSAVNIGRARKYATVEERIVAQKSRDKRRKAIVKMLLAKYSAGEITIDEVMADMDDDSGDE